MPERTEFECSQLRHALEFININIAEWNDHTPEDRKKNYHKIIIKALLKNHPDKHPQLPKDSAEFIQYCETTTLLNSIDYDHGTSDYESSFSSEPAPAQATSSVDIPHEFTMPKNIDELVKNLKKAGYPPYPRNKGNAYYEAIKECIPNIVTWEEHGKLDQYYCGSDFSYIVTAINTKCCLKNYQGADVFVSALVSKNKNRIKDAFDQMINKVKNEYSILNFFSTPESRVAGLIDKFCKFNKRIDGEVLLPSVIDKKTVLLFLCKSLSLMLPYHIIDLNSEMDQELVRTLLTEYAAGKATLQLEAGPAAEEVKKIQMG